MKKLIPLPIMTKVTLQATMKKALSQPATISLILPTIIVKVVQQLIMRKVVLPLMKRAMPITTPIHKILMLVQTTQIQLNQKIKRNLNKSIHLISMWINSFIRDKKLRLMKMQLQKIYNS